MLVHKLRVGVLHVSSPDGLRCIPLERSERLLFMWVFRHFRVLPEILLGGRTLQLVNDLRLGDRPIQRCSCVHPLDRDAVIGTVECETPLKRPPQSAPEWTPQPQLSTVPAAAVKN